MQERIDGTMLHLRAGWIRAEVIAVLPVSLWPDRPCAKTAATIRADVPENIFHARAAEGAFEAATHGFRRIRRKPCVAVLAGGSQFEHDRRSVVCSTPRTA